MLTINNVCRNVPASYKFLIAQARYKSKTHWAKLKRKNGAKHKAMAHFDEFYGSVFGAKWEPMKEALLRKSKYVALINNYGDAEETMEYLSNRGAHCLRKLITVQKEYHDAHSPEPQPASQTVDRNKKLQELAQKAHEEEISKIYPKTDNVPERLDLRENKEIGYNEQKKKNIQRIEPSTKTLDQSLAEAEIDETRLIDPSVGLTSETLYLYIPATKLKGMDDWIPESLHYSYYSKTEDFPLSIETDTELVYPEHLKVFTYEMDSEWIMFPEPKRCQTGVFNYYPLDGGSVVSVLALGLRAGERLLDLCAAPGGKALLALQTLLPDVVVCNDVSSSRLFRTKRTFKDYLFDFETSNKWRERVVFTKVDARIYKDDEGFDKVLVDVPCTTDRHSVNEDENNIFRPDRIKERLRIPELQSQLLVNALTLVKVGGTVVYSTCSLSPIQNDGVVHMALKQAFETHDIIVTVKDMSNAFRGLSSTLHLLSGDSAPRYGQLVVPDITANFGPSYIAKLVRVK